MRAFVLAAILAAAGCASAPPTTYRWGSYEDSLYRMYVDPEDFNPAAEAQKLSIEVEQTVAEHRRVPPGLHAHLGYLCAAAGDSTGAAAHFAAEKAAFPESAKFVDGMTQRMSK